MLETQQTSLFQTQYVYLLAILLAVLWNQHKKIKFHKRISRSRTTSASITDDDKIIVALQIKNLFIQYSDRKLTNFIPLQMQKSKQTVFQQLLGLFGYGSYYKLMCEKTKIKSFLKSLRSFENVEIYLYTSLPKAFTQKILKKLGIDNYFPQQYRRYCQQQDVKLNEKKHPSWIDHNTRRVMIVTPNKQDYDEEDKKYFLTLNRLTKQKLLKRSFSLIKHIVGRVQHVDQLHAQMEEIKAQIETDCQIEEEACPC